MNTTHLRTFVDFDGKAAVMARIYALVLAALMLPPRVVNADDTVIYYHTDAIGSVRMITDANGGILQRFDYLPFGIDCAPNPPCVSQPPDTRQFAGKDRDTDTSFDYFGARYYDGVTGRFVTVDPLLDVSQALVDPQLWNRYTYALNNPFKFTDPDGRNPMLVGGAIGAGVYAAWNSYLNVQQGRPWYENIGVEASKGFLVGATLGLVAAPAIATASVAELGTLSVTELGIALAGVAGVQRALRSADAAIRFEGETASFLAERGLLKAFNVNIGGRQIDAIAGAARNFVIEMTTGQGGGKIAQAAAQTKATGLGVIIYGKNLTAGFVREALRQGYRVARSPEELEKILREQ